MPANKQQPKKTQAQVEVKEQEVQVQAQVQSEVVAEPKKTGGAKKASEPKKAGASKKVAAKKAAPKKASAKAASAKTGGAKKAAPKTATKKASVKKEFTAATVPSEEVVEEGGKNRFFKVIYDDLKAHGRFSGTKPKQAANKAFTSIVKAKGGQLGGGRIKFSIQECTRGSKQKRYNYIGSRVALENPVEILIGKDGDSKKIVYRFNNRIMKDKDIVGVQA